MSYKEYCSMFMQYFYIVRFPYPFSIAPKTHGEEGNGKDVESFARQFTLRDRNFSKLSDIAFYSQFWDLKSNITGEKMMKIFKKNVKRSLCCEKDGGRGVKFYGNSHFSQDIFIKSHIEPKCNITFITIPVQTSIESRNTFTKLEVDFPLEISN